MSNNVSLKSILTSFILFVTSFHANAQGKSGLAHFNSEIPGSSIKLQHYTRDFLFDIAFMLLKLG